MPEFDSFFDRAVLKVDLGQDRAATNPTTAHCWAITLRFAIFQDHW
jgi:hypothetical protein